MRRYIDDYKNGKYIFIGDFDSYNVIKNKVSEVELFEILKIAVFLYDGIFIPAAYFWQSYPMSLILPKIQLLIENEIVLPTIRNYQLTSDVKEYFERRESDTQNLLGTFCTQIPELRAEIATKNNLKDAMALHRMNKYVHLENMSIMDSFRELFEIDVMSSLDVNSIRNILSLSSYSVSEVIKIQKILLQQAQSPNFQRSNLINIIVGLNVGKVLEEQLCDRISWLYLSASADTVNAKLFLSKGKYNGTIREENLFIFINTLMRLGVTKQFITSLTINDILILKKSSEYQEFIRIYRELVWNIGLEEKNIETIIQRKISKQIFKEKSSVKLYNALQFLNNASATIFLETIINYLFNGQTTPTITTVTGSTMAITYFLKKLDIFNEQMKKSSFLEFKDYIAKKKYNDEINRRIGGIW